MDLGDLLSALITPPGEAHRRRRDRLARLERVFGWLTLIGVALFVAFVWLAYSGF